MKNTIDKQELIDWLNEYASHLLVRGPMFGSFSEQEAILHTLLNMRSFVTGKNSSNHINESRYNICRKYKFNLVFSFSDQVPLSKSCASSKEQAYFSQILIDWCEYE